MAAGGFAGKQRCLMRAEPVDMIDLLRFLSSEVIPSAYSAIFLTISFQYIVTLLKTLA